MTLAVHFLHAVPHQKAATLLREHLARCREASIIAGFATPDGVAALQLEGQARKITRLVLGVGTFKAFEALDDLLRAGLPPAAARLHLGFIPTLTDQNRCAQSRSPMDMMRQG